MKNFWGKTLLAILLGSSLSAGKYFYERYKKHEKNKEISFTSKERSEIFKDYLIYQKFNINEDSIKKYEKKGLDKYEMIVNYAAGISPSEINKFNDNPKNPNALIVYSKCDEDNALISTRELAMYNNLKNNYDISLNCCSDTSEINRALDKIKNPDLIMFICHGTSSSMLLDEKNYIDTNSLSTINKLSKKGEADCVFFSCLTGNKLAPYVKKKAPNLTIHASKISFNDFQYKINSTYPFDIEFFKDGVDYTYKK